MKVPDKLPCPSGPRSIAHSSRCEDQANVRSLVDVSKACSPVGFVMPTVDLGTRVQNLPGMMGKPGQMHAILFARDRFGGFALFNVEDLDDLVVTRSNQVIALIVEIQRSHIAGVWFRGFESLQTLVRG